MTLILHHHKQLSNLHLFSGILKPKRLHWRKSKPFKVSETIDTVSNDSSHCGQRREIVFEIEVDKNIPPIHHGTVETG